MARKNTNRYPLLTTQSLSASFNSPATLIKEMDNIAYQINITTSDSTGTFIVQGSNDFNMAEVPNIIATPGNWVTLALGGGTPIANAANDQIIIDLNEVPYNALRLVYTSTIAGTGVADIWVMTKQIGG